ncbi:Vegetative incompatibility protein HET-E-1 [Cercospora beticola]|uniref:Vegetative incompatibility protein HET-E-1 n=1 Tax=Cercospora beticola TaxID=122368 RepID=A0A2G5I8Y5_CERBT|nr:Vegetative incompatibility protein HET-E-1 [Cercospora beticola]PIB00933.1 Vegetative incompatibility protein HET-E-1 [Cercospora beticola]WPA97717.1 hypothetical protein RHO25_002328 [Cercospora beticola]
MRLLHVEELRFEEFFDENVPPYAIASHRWGAEEVTLQDLQQNRATSKIGYKKIQAFAKYARENLKSINWIWIDTCCIDKTSAAELSESVNLMFKWYRNAEICLAYLADIPSAGEPHGYLRSEWFRRGWTLQELLAPRVVIFLTGDWQVIGNKGASLNDSIQSAAGSGLEPGIAVATRLPEDVLHDFDKSKSISRSEKLRWMEGRDTTRKEDLSYGLYGIFNVYLGANYGEGFRGARDRLIAALPEREDREQRQADQFRKITEWLAPPDPWTDHETARNERAAQTGDWLLQSPIYQEWKHHTTNLLWLHGKAGCGKTILCSTAIEDIRVYCNSRDDIGYAVFYCAFSDSRKQSLRTMLLSIVAQVCSREPGLAMLQNAYEKHNRVTLSADDLEKIMFSTLRAYKTMYLLVDGVDECPEDNDNRRGVLEFLVRLSHRASNVRILAASRDEPGIRSSMQASKAAQLPINTHAVDADIRRYISAEILRDLRLSRLDSQTKAQIEDTLTQRADGMFRWTFCQLQEVKKLKSTKPRSIQQALFALPATLDATYERILETIGENVRDDALILLRWIAYAQEPLTLEQLVETTIIDLDQEASVGIDNRGGLMDTLEILSGLIITEGPKPTRSWAIGPFSSLLRANRAAARARKARIRKARLPKAKRAKAKWDIFDDSTDEDGSQDEDDSTSDNVFPSIREDCLKNTTVRLAHFSVKEYLESTRILQGSARGFQLSSAREHWIIAQSCLAYLLFYSRHAQKSHSLGDLKAFPLLHYAAKTWYVHLSSKSTEKVAREATVLLQEDVKHDWLLIHRPDDPWFDPFMMGPIDEAPALYYASYLGLQSVVQSLVDAGADVNDDSGIFSPALVAASTKGHETIVEALLKAGANLKVELALHEAATSGHAKVAKMLIEVGATFHAAKEPCDAQCTLLSTASEAGYREIVEMLIMSGVNVNTACSPSLTPLMLASQRGDVEIVGMLLDAGADPIHRALEAASLNGHREVVKKMIETLLEREKSPGANQTAGPLSEELIAACNLGLVEAAEVLIKAGANVNNRGRLETSWGVFKNVNALEVVLASDEYKYSVELAGMLLTAGAVLENPIKGRLNEALITASGAGSGILVRRLIQEGADVNTLMDRRMRVATLQKQRYTDNTNALRLAIAHGHESVVKLLLAAGAQVHRAPKSWIDLSHRNGDYQTDVQLALNVGNEKIVQLLLDAGAKIEDRTLVFEDKDGNIYGSAIQAELTRGNKRIAQMLRGARAVSRKRRLYMLGRRIPPFHGSKAH